MKLKLMRRPRGIAVSESPSTSVVFRLTSDRRFSARATRRSVSVFARCSLTGVAGWSESVFERVSRMGHELSSSVEVERRLDAMPSVRCRDLS